MDKLLLYCLLCSLIYSCNENESPDTDKSSSVRIISDEKLNGRSEASIMGEFGNPKSHNELKIYSNVELYEYQNNLLQLFDLNQEDTILVKEINWVFKNEDRLVVWFTNTDNQNWISIDNLKWGEDVKW